MRLTRYRVYINFILLLTIAPVVFYSCANIGRPTGGPVDELPPVFVKSTPYEGEMNVMPKRIVIEFNENIKLDKPNEKVVVSPPQLQQPVVKSNGRRLTVELKDSLLQNTTYTIDFSNAIQDNNEGNPLENFSFSFSTGEYIDTLQVSGRLLNAADLEPVSGAYVGLQSNLNDTAFVKRPLVRVAKTNEYGDFTIKNVSPGTYRLYALKDINNNYMFDLPTEDIAFHDSIITPSIEIKLHNDTIYKDSVTIDTIIVHQVPHYYPDDIVLKMFNENKKRLYFEKAERSEKNKVVMYFSAPMQELPTLKGLNFDIQDWAIVEPSRDKDTITYWIKDSLVYNIDTLRMTSEHLYTDSLGLFATTTDTLRLYQRIAKNVPKKKDKQQAAADTTTQFLKFKDLIQSSMNIGVRPAFIFDEPIASINYEGIHIEHKRDSVYELMASRFEQSSDNIRKYVLNSRLSAGETYLVTIDSAAITSIYGRHNDTFTKQFKVKNIEEFGNLLVDVPDVKGPAFIELLNKSDKPVMKSSVIDGAARFKLVPPGEYYLRLVFDINNNGVYDTGNYENKQQPEEVRYFHEPITVRANWDVRQEWDIYALPLIKQKPLQITKNKPKEKKTAANDTQSNEESSGSMRYGGGTITPTSK